MELLKRKYLNESNNIVKLGTNFEREFSLTSNVIKFSFMLPLEKLREVDYFQIKYNQIDKMKEFNDVVFVENGSFKLEKMEVKTVIMMNGKNKDFAKLSYSGIVEKHEKIIAYPTFEVSDTKGWIFDTKTTINRDYIRTFY